jgi:hypothetical protein
MQYLSSAFSLHGFHMVGFDPLVPICIVKPATCEPSIVQTRFFTSTPFNAAKVKNDPG